MGSHDAELPGKSELVIRGARYSNDMVFATSKDELRLVNGGSIANDAYGTMVYTKRLTHVNNTMRTEVATKCVPDGIPNTNSKTGIPERLFLISTRDLAEGEEILTSYGKSYWDQVPDDSAQESDNSITEDESTTTSSSFDSISARSDDDKSMPSK